MNERQRRFADEYIISRNATEAAIKAGYSKKTARSIGNENLTKPDISEYIKKRTEELFNERSMSVAEALALSASIARGEVQQGSSKQVDNRTGEILKDVSYEYTPTIEERQKSLEHIMKIGGAFDTKNAEQDSSTVNHFYFDRGEIDEA